MTSQTGQQISTINILPNTSRSKDNQTIKFGQLIEYNMRNISFKNHPQNMVKKLVQNPFIKNQNWAYLWINSLKYYSLFLLYIKVEVYQNVLKLRSQLTFTCSKSTKKTCSKLTIKTTEQRQSLTSFWCFYCYLWKYFIPFSRVSIVDFEQVNFSWDTAYLRSETVSLPHFLHDFWRKLFPTLYFINWSNFIVWLHYSWEIGQTCIVIIRCPVSDDINFENNLNFLAKPFFYITKKSGQKCKYFKNETSF